MAVVILGMPSYGSIHPGAARALWGCPSDGRNKCLPGAKGNSLLARTFNDIWHSSLQIKKKQRPDVTHFAMLHADVVPEPGWIDILVDEIERTGADMVSCVVPIKDSKGLTSTAIEDPDDQWDVLRRLTMHEVHRLPETFGIRDTGYDDGRALLVNTGCWIADLSKPWVHDVCFTIRDHIRHPGEPGYPPDTGSDLDGAPQVCVVSEDWGLSHWLHHECGATVLATRRVKLTHHESGSAHGYPNYPAWGEWQVDEGKAFKHDRVPVPIRRVGLADRSRGATTGGTGNGSGGAGDRLLAGPLDVVPGADGPQRPVSRHVRG